jgi:hypothetical protein
MLEPSFDWLIHSLFANIGLEFLANRVNDGKDLAVDFYCPLTHVSLDCHGSIPCRHG